MGKFREWLREAEEKTTEYQKFFAKKLEKYGVKSPSELSDEDKKKFYDEVDSEWEGEDEKLEQDEACKVNESKATWDDASLAASDAFLSLERRGWKVKMNGNNSIKAQHDNGVVGILTFDPTNKF